jgi:hypothetical protein
MTLPEWVLPVGALVTAIALSLWLTVENYKELIRTKPMRIAARREEKRKKNERLKRFLGL